MMWGYGWNWPSMGLMMFGSLLLIVVLVMLGWALVRGLNRRTTGLPRPLAGNGLTAAEVLNQRYARGEIDATTFEQMRERLRASDDAQQRSGVDGHRPVGEKLFDGTTRRGSDIL